MSKRIVPLALLLLLLLACSGPGARADAGSTPASRAALDWPQWRGPNRDAVSPETGLLDDWPEAGPTVVWRSAGGAGFSSVSVVAGLAYTLWDEGGTQYLVCLDALTGKRVWRHELGPKFTHYYGNGPRSTPVIDGGVVFTIGTSGRIVAVGAKDGKLEWQHDLVGEFGTKLPSYGYSSSPLVVGDKLVVETGAQDRTYMAFDKGSGEIAWASENDTPAYSSPIDVSIGGVRQVVFWSAHGLHAVSSDDGKLLWQYRWETFCPVSGDPLNTGTPIFLAPDRIYISSGSGATMLRVSRSEGGFEVEPVWRNDEMRSDVNSAVLLDGHIYGFDRGILKCLDAANGEVKWQARGFERGSLLAADGKLIVLGEKGNLALVDANPDAFVQRASVRVLEGRNWTAPSLAGGKLYLRNQEELVCLDLEGRATRQGG